ncbi:hypothetical protein D3C78_1492990 [compost metagenome]
MYSSRPAIIWASPPKKIPMLIMAEFNGKKPALCRFSKTVVIPKPIRPRGPGFANLLVCISPLQ